MTWNVMLGGVIRVKLANNGSTLLPQSSMINCFVHDASQRKSVNVEVLTKINNQRICFLFFILQICKCWYTILIDHIIIDCIIAVTLFRSSGIIFAPDRVK